MIKKTNMQLNRYSPTTRYRGCKWEFHLTDVDDFPSVLHAHAVEKALRLDGNTGIFYDEITRKKMGKIRQKELTALHRDKEFRKFAYKRIETYNEKNPCKKVRMPDWVHAPLAAHYKQFGKCDEIFSLYTK